MYVIILCPFFKKLFIILLPTALSISGELIKQKLTKNINCSPQQSDYVCLFV